MEKIELQTKVSVNYVSLHRIRLFLYFVFKGNIMLKRIKQNNNTDIIIEYNLTLDFRKS